MASTTTTTKTLIVKITMGGDIRRYTANEGLTWPQVAKRASESFELGAKKFKMTYVDDEGDKVTVSSDEELREAINLAFVQTPAVLRVTVTPDDTTKTDAAQTTDAAPLPKSDEMATDAAAKDVAAFVNNIAKQLPALYTQLPEPLRNMMPHADLDLAATVAANLGGDSFVHPHPPKAKVGVHDGVTCDKSGVSPIVGNRYHLPGHNYDLCEGEFDKLPEKEKALFTKIPPPETEPTGAVPPAGFHPGVQCDRSGMLPIVGTRFKLRGHNYDLCEGEFDKLPEGEKALYDAIPPPMTNAPHVANLASAFANGASAFAAAAAGHGHGQGPWRPHGRCGWGRGWGGKGGMGGMGGMGGGKGGMGGMGGKGKGGHGEFGPPAGKGKGCGPKFAARFVCDVTVFDGTQVAPKTPFTKIWRLKNVGDLPWPAGTKMLFVGGDQMTTEMSVPLGRDTPVMPGEEVDAAVEMTAPADLGRYLGYWRLTGPHERMRFGQRVWCHIQVVDPTQPEGPIDVESALAEFEKMKSNLGADDADDDDYPAADEATTAAAAAAATTSGSVKMAEALMPTRDDDLVGAPLPPVPLPPTPLEDKPAEPAPLPPTPLEDKPAEPELEPMNDGSDDGVLVTETMIIEALPAAEAAAGPSGGGEPLSVKASLVAMGFTDPTMVDAVLAKNGDDLEACAADLAAASEWDSLLDDLHEMGFANRELNKTLMLKNGGNIKRTVKDLVEA